MLIASVSRIQDYVTFLIVEIDRVKQVTWQQTIRCLPATCKKCDADVV
jgi:hypothetical protein